MFHLLLNLDVLEIPYKHSAGRFLRPVLAFAFTVMHTGGLFYYMAVCEEEII